MKLHDDPTVTAEELLEKADVKPTSNRVLVLRTIMGSRQPMSLIELETALETMDRSSVLRVLNLLLDHHVIHAVEDGRGVSKYELCHGGDHCTVDDMHVHFYCEKCGRTICFEEISAPQIHIPEVYLVRSVNYMLKGVCPDCRHGE